MTKTMTALLAGIVVAASITVAAPASAQSITIGPNGPGIDLRSRGQRERDYDREMRRRDRDDYYREQRFRERDRDDRRGYGRRSYDY